MKQKLLEMYETCGLKGEEKLKYINEKLGMDIPSQATLRKKIQRIRENNSFAEGIRSDGFSGDNWSHGWLKKDGMSVFIRNQKEFDFEALIDDMCEKIKKHSPEYKKISYNNNGDHCLIVDMADHHFGKLADVNETGNIYNLEIAQQRFNDGLDGIINKSKGFKKDKVLFIVGNDVLHTDNPFKKTTAGTPQDTDGMWHKAFDVALESYVNALEKLQQIAPVEVIYNPSNHDYMSGYMLVQALKAWFNTNKNIDWKVNMIHRKYTLYGNSLLGFSHGDGAKEKDVGMLCATEVPHLWAESKFRYLYLHHLHHKIAKDQIGITIEYLRSASGTDRWHSDNGYISKPAVDGFLISKENGQVARLTNYF